MIDYLTYKDFATDLNYYGFDLEKHHNRIDVVAQDLGAIIGGSVTIASVSTTEQYNFECSNIDDTLVKVDEWQYLANQCLRLAATPLNMRGNYSKWWNPFTKLAKKLVNN